MRDVQEVQLNMEQFRQCRIPAKQGTETREKNWAWVEASIWTERMLAALENGVKGGKWYSLFDKICSRPTLRPLGIPAVMDRIVQTVVKMVLDPIFENEFLAMSYGFRPGRGCKDALREVAGLLEAGFVHVVDADFKSYFDSIPHRQLLSRIKDKVSDARVIRLIEQFLGQDILDGLERWTPTSGSPQGAVISPLLANLYLHPLDVLITGAGYKMVRYADELVILCKTAQEAHAALALLQEWGGANGLSLHPGKTRVDNWLEPKEGFEFLGYRFESGRRYVRAKSLKALKDRIREKTRRSRGASLKTIVGDLNPTLKGWFEYFKHAHKTVFSSIDGFVRRRLRAILRKQEKRPGRGICHADHRCRPNAFFANHELFTMTEAHGQACRPR